MFYLQVLCMISNVFILVLTISSETEDLDPLSNEFILTINNGSYSWSAGENFPKEANTRVIHNLMGASLTDYYYNTLPNVSSVAPEYKEDIPTSFDARNQWTNCYSLNEIREQGACANCWAVSAAATMMDRYCIHSNQTQNFHFSSMDLFTCAINEGCTYGGHISMAWRYYNSFGVVSGGEYGSKSGCKPFKLPPCDMNNGCNTTADMPLCYHICTNDYKWPYKKDKKYAKSIYIINGGEEQMQMDIYKNGPVQAVMAVYADFLSYKNGVYRHVLGKIIGEHAIKLLGWGEENGIKYWIAANSWGERWGDKGFFKIVRGENHCSIESVVMAGIPAIDGNTTHYDSDLNFFNRAII